MEINEKEKINNDNDIYVAAVYPVTNGKIISDVNLSVIVYTDGANIQINVYAWAEHTDKCVKKVRIFFNLLN